MEPTHECSRNSDVAAWIKRHRDSYNREASQSGAEAWQAVDDLLNDYRTHADYGLPLHQEVNEGLGGET